jgi:hypothetical protein
VLTPIITAAQEAEIRRITFQSQPGQADQKTLTQKKNHQKGLVEWVRWQECLPSTSEALRSNPSAPQKREGTEVEFE